MGTNTVASMVVFEGGAPKKSDYRRFKVFTVGDGANGGNQGPDDFASMEEVLSRRMARWEQQRDVSPHDKDYDPSFAALPNVGRDRRRQRPAVGRAARAAGVP